MKSAARTAIGSPLIKQKPNSSKHMKPKKSRAFSSTLTMAFLTFAAPSVFALEITWDGSDTVTSGAQGGAGTWNANTTANWWDGSADVVWPDSGTDNDAIFGGTGGTVTISSVTANDLKIGRAHV